MASETTNQVIRGTNDKPVASADLASYFETTTAVTGGQLIVGYPITATTEGKRPVDAIYVAPGVGVVVFDVVEGNAVGDFADRQDDLANRLEARLRTHTPLVSRRKLQVPIHTVTYAPAISSARLPAPEEDYFVANRDTVGAVLGSLEWPEHTEVLFEHAVSALQSVSGIRRTATPRPVADESSRGAKLSMLERAIATLDAQQGRAVVETADDVQRIRGLAGSGKTIVLALKAAYLHAQHPEWRIAVTFNTRSLRAQFERLINTFTIEQSGEEPDWERLRVLQAWGAAGGGVREGIYHQFCVENDVPYYDFGSAKHNFGSDLALSGACAVALENATSPRNSYDAILVDEAQDLPRSFLRLCHAMLGETKRLVYAYDELQTLNGTGLPSAEELFGDRPDGRPWVTFGDESPESPHRDIILEKCYRNSRPVLVTAHALGFGIYRNRPKNATTGLVQIFEQKSLWEDIGYRVESGELEDGQHVRLARDRESSPTFLETHSPTSDLLHFASFDSVEHQASWVADQIVTNLSTDELRANDIIVINPDPFTTRDNLGIIRRRLLEHGVASHLAGVDVGADIFFQPDANSVTFTGIHRAKGNEAAMVYVVNAQESFSATANLARVRNRLFTAITRSKAWVRVTGVGPDMARLLEEFERVRKADFTLDFTYPTLDERATLQILHRDMSRADQRRVSQSRKSLDSLVENLEAGNTFPEDLDTETLERLQRLLKARIDDE